MDREAVLKEKVRRNMARIKSCKLHDFDWQRSVNEYRARRVAAQEKWGVIINVHPVIVCRCKNCGGKMPVGYAAIYMEAVKHMKDTLNKGGQAHGCADQQELFRGTAQPR